MVDFDRFWMKGHDPYEDEDEVVDEPEDEAPPGVTLDEIEAWERRYGLGLPEPIRTALTFRNGGYVRGAQIEVLPLDQIAPVGEEFWAYTDLEDDEAPEHDLMFKFGHAIEVSGTLLMNFNARGPQSEPSIYIDYHGETTNLISDTLSELFEAVKTSHGPEAEWWDEKGDDNGSILGRETIDLSAQYRGRAASEEQVIARKDKVLILFTREKTPKGEIRTCTTLPLPLDPEWAEIRPFRPAPISTFTLHLQPLDSDGIVQVRSVMTEEGRWKNSTEQGTPIYVLFESTARERLEAVRVQLFGDEAANRAQARQAGQKALQDLLDTLSPDQRVAVMMQAAMDMRQGLNARFEAPGPVPPDLAQAAETLKLRLDAMVEQVRQKIAGHPIDPATLRRILELLLEQAPDGGG